MINKIRQWYRRRAVINQLAAMDDALRAWCIAAEMYGRAGVDALQAEQLRRADGIPTWLWLMSPRDAYSRKWLDALAREKNHRE